MRCSVFWQLCLFLCATVVVLYQTESLNTGMIIIKKIQFLTPASMYFSTVQTEWKTEKSNSVICITLSVEWLTRWQGFIHQHKLKAITDTG